MAADGSRFLSTNFQKIEQICWFLEQSMEDETIYLGRASKKDLLVDYLENY
jgi:hypothetical protein